jgi:hypothetical protein
VDSHRNRIFQPGIGILLHRGEPVWSKIRPMHTWVYKGNRKANTYLYISQRDDFGQVPDSLLKLMGELKLVVDFELHSERRLARADTVLVMQQLQSTGYFLQLPPVDPRSRKPC